jgi:hypothetical protein
MQHGSTCSSVHQKEHEEWTHCQTQKGRRTEVDEGGGIFSVSRFYHHAAKFGLGTFLTSVVGPIYFFLLLLLVPNKTGAARNHCLFLFMAVGREPQEDPSVATYLTAISVATCKPFSSKLKGRKEGRQVPK